MGWLGWLTEIDGHNFEEIAKVLDKNSPTNLPKIIAKTVKGKGCRF